MGSSAPSTTLTGEQFGVFATDKLLPEQLDVIRTIAEKEGWLLSEKEVQVAKSGILGAGGFSIAVSGCFQGAPVVVKLSKHVGRLRPLADIGNELRILRKLRHPNIVTLYGGLINATTQEIVIVLEMIKGMGMDHFIARCAQQSLQMTAASRCQSLLGVCRALMYLHSRTPCIVHGDVKAPNIMVENRMDGPHSRLLDFGLARIITRRARPLGTTYRWAAPELFVKTGPPHPAVDSFS